MSQAEPTSSEPGASSASRARWREAGAIAAASFALRAALAAWVQRAGTDLTGDEISYFARAQAIAGGAANGFDGVYMGGAWPPLHSLWMSFGFALPVDELLAARVAMALASALTTGAVFALGAWLFSPRAGRAAALLHALHPIFLAYSHMLWSENLYLLLMLAAFAATSSAVRTGSLRASLAAGCALGAMALTRAAAAPFFLALPLALAWLGPAPSRARNALVLLATACAVSLPWQIALWQHEGRLALFSSQTGVQIYAGNNPHEQSLWSYQQTQRSFRERADRALNEIQLEAATSGTRASEAASRLGRAYLLEHPGAFVRRSFERAAFLLSHDGFVLRHALSVVYPPLPTGAVLLAWLASALVFALALGAAIAVLVRRIAGRRESLVCWVFVACAALPPLVTVTHTRLAFPLFGLLLPFAGQGLVMLARTGESRRALAPLALVLSALLLADAVALLPVNVRVQAKPSSRHAPGLAVLDGLVPGASVYKDELLLRDARGRTLELEGATPGVEFRGRSEDPSRMRLAASPAGARVRFWSRGDAPARLRVRAAGARRWHEFEATSSHAWRRWAPTGLQGVEFWWSGGGRLQPAR